MTYLGRIDVFQCDCCNKREEVSSGLPVGWVWIKTGGKGVEHACHICKELLTPEQKKQCRCPGRVN